MEIHLLDFIMWILLIKLLWDFLDSYYAGDFTEDLGSFVGIIICLIFTIIYIILFAIYPDWNWIDIFNSINLPNFKFKM